MSTRSAIAGQLLMLFAAVTLTTGCSREVQRPGADAPSNALNPQIIANTDPEALFLHDAAADPRVLHRSWEGIPSIGSTADGRQMYVAWYSGGTGEGPGNYVTVAFSGNKALSWKRDALIVYPRDASQVRMYDPGLWRDKFGTVWLTWTKSHQFWDGVGGVWTMPLEWNGQSVVPGQVSHLSNGVMLNKPTYIHSSGTMLFPVSWWSFAPADPGKQGAYIYSSTYKTGTSELESPRVLTKITIPDSIRTYDEHQLVETSDNGGLLCLVRTYAGIYATSSKDNGEHWSRLEPFKAVGATANSRFHISRLQSGRLLLVINNDMARTRLTAFLSSDGGKTWNHKLVIDRRPNVSYPDAIQTSDGHIHLVYDRDRFTAKDILYCRFTEADILKSNEKGIVRAKVNK